MNSLRSPCHRSDFICLYYLEKYGGMWLDASIINMKPISKWLLSVSKKYNLKKEKDILIGYGHPEDNSILENWLFYCSPNCSFMTLWKNEFMYALKIGFEKYCDINKDFYEKEFPKKVLFFPYLTMHLCFCVVKQKKEYKQKL